LGRKTSGNAAEVDRWPARQSLPRASGHGVLIPDDREGPSAEPQHKHHPLRDAWTIVATTAWLILHGLIWLAFAAIMLAAAVVGISCG
jgi:hypothetical protein